MQSILRYKPIEFFNGGKINSPESNWEYETQDIYSDLRLN